MVCGILPFLAPSAHADGEFLQVDLSESTSTGTLSIARGPLTYGASAVSYEGGSTYGLSATYKLPVAEQFVTLRLGPALGYVKDNGKDGSFEAGLKLVAERYIPTDFGSVFLLADLNSIENSWFVLAQFGLSGPGLSFELSHGESDTYSETSLAVAKRLGDSPTSLRAGYRFDADEIFVGLSINTF
ncbi:hypothetical protein ACFQFQ_16840 [Sulfitobacter porphyrae]|uniref:Outer membrane protein beta-barrel domain-containing protein n=1 Tax=Sulfitobacter porphyrae TaxID=1246864 RepID=A0ABW2B5G7_9RHOB|nr:hypothetical protein GCM10007928_06170 [Sulfitobacter porphyrae]